MAKKAKTAYVCQSCGYDSSKWLGKCPSCQSWNSFVEEIIHPETVEKTQWQVSSETGKPKVAVPTPISEIIATEEQRTRTGDDELDRVLGGGIVAGAVILVGGEPGIGKSTLMLQLGLQLNQLKTVYVSGEESAQQIKMRADRLPWKSENCFILTETNTQAIFLQLEQTRPNVVIIDSIQTLHSSYIESGAGSVSQVRECTAELIKFAKETHTPVFLIGHITKEGSIAGPKVLEHMVDTVLQFEGDRHLSYRILRTIKNRFGSTAELGIYEMRAEGLRQVSNPSEILISQREGDLSGVSIGATLEGNRPLLIEVQSLVSPSVYGTPQRSCTGFDSKRLNMLLAVLEKRAGFKVGFNDVFLNITGGLRIEDPALDLAVCTSILSSLNDTPIPSRVCFAAEVGLGGEIRAVNRIENRVAEAAKLGFEEMYVSKFNQKSLPKKLPINVHFVSRLDDLVQFLF
jgi:DNA repair protein RadA/Sms